MADKMGWRGSRRWWTRALRAISRSTDLGLGADHRLDRYLVRHIVVTLLCLVVIVIQQIGEALDVGHQPPQREHHQMAHVVRI